jgi:micrococcal nuclease
MFARNAILSIPVSKKCWIRLAALINFAKNTVCSPNFNRTSYHHESADIRRFFVSITSIIALTFCTSSALASPSCENNENKTSTVLIKYVLDGDTVLLSNGEKLRLIGIDSPEIGYNGQASEAMALAARDFVDRLVDKNRQYSLQYGPERQDHHGRSLGHLFLADGSSLQSLILAAGLATPLNIPPNILFADCYLENAEQARFKKTGIWQLEKYQLHPANTLSKQSRGYRIITGRISHTARSDDNVWINLNNHLAIRINKRDLKYFPALNITELPGQQVQIRGKVYLRNNQLRLQIRHPHDFRLIGGEN